MPRRKILPLVSTNIRELNAAHVDIKNLNKPTLIAGFPGPGLVGSISTSYIIDTLKMRQIAYIESEYITPGVIYIGGKLRHPFRLYANEKGNVCVAVCEAPILINDIRLVLDILIKWSIEKDVREIIVLDGIPMRGIPREGRQPIILHDDGLHKKEEGEIENITGNNNNSQDKVNDISINQQIK